MTDNSDFMRKFINLLEDDSMTDLEKMSRGMIGLREEHFNTVDSELYGKAALICAIKYLGESNNKTQEEAIHLIEELLPQLIDPSKLH